VTSQFTQVLILLSVYKISDIHIQMTVFTVVIFPVTKP